MRYVHSSLTRISNLADERFDVRRTDRSGWRTGDYVVGEVYGVPSSLYRIELANGRHMPVMEGDCVVGAFGRRSATLEANGDWEHIDEDGRMDALTGGGLFGRCTSRSAMMPSLLKMKYMGHVWLDGRPARMKDYVERVDATPFTTPSILLIGSSMSSGKTTAARTLIRLLKTMGATVLGAKLTGAGRFRDVLSMHDAGADHIFDFVDVGLPSTICDEASYRSSLRGLLHRMGAVDADVAVIESGASPMEPYNGAAAVHEIKPHIRLMVLCTSDPYAVIGVRDAFGHAPDLVTGPATNTEAGISLVEHLSGIQALNVLDRSSHPEFERILRTKLDWSNGEGS
ncbi:MAG: hypothetical protein WD021_07820 [Rhodothermales bacterium]